jgi:hypothetical protein
MKPLLAAAALIAATAGACSTGGGQLTGAAGTTGTGGTGGTGGLPPSTVVTFELLNNSAATVYLFQECWVESTITSLADPPHVIERPGPCGCDCAQAVCPLCGACFQGSREVAAGAVMQEFWSPASVTYEPAPPPVGTCSRTHALPDGPYRIDIPVYPTAEDAVARTGARIATQSFALPVLDESVTVALGVSP